MGGFEFVDERQVPVDPDSPLGRAMADARQAWAQPGYQPLDPETWRSSRFPSDWTTPPSSSP